MTPQVNKQIKLLRDVLEKKSDIKQIFLFGSYAYGKPSEESDIDLCTIADLSSKRKIDVMREIRRESLNVIPNALDILVYLEDEFRERSHLGSTLEHKILTDGIRLHG